MGNMIAVILSGGQSSRMGEDKGLKQKQDVSWVETLQQKLAYLSMPVYISVNPLQQASYSQVFPTQLLIIDEPLEGINGPLKGIVSAHRAHPQQHILCLPCDMPELDAPVFNLWLDYFHQQYPQYHVFVSQTPDGLQPLCGIYSQEGLQTLSRLYQHNQLTNQSMHAIVEKMLNTYILQVPDLLVPLFKNYNTPQDLA